MKVVGCLTLAIGLSFLAGCETGMQRVHEPQALIAPPEQAVLVVVEPRSDYLNAVVLDNRGSCIGYTQGGAWFALRLRAGQHILHVKESETMLSAKIDVGAGKTYFLEPRFKSTKTLELHSINPTAKDWSELDAMLKEGSQFRVDRKKCNSTLSEMVWMPGQDLKQLIGQGNRNAQAADPIITPADGVVWQGSAAKSAH